MSLERQKSALNDLYQEKKRHLLVTRGALVRDAQIAEEKIAEGEGTRAVGARPDQRDRHRRRSAL